MLRRRSLNTALLACALAAGSCGSAETPARNPGAASAAGKHEDRPKTGLGRFSRSWEAKLAADVNRIVIQQDSVVTLGSVGVDRFATSDGRSLGSSRGGCLTLAADFTKNGKVVIVCPTEIRSVDLVTYQSEVLKTFTATAVAAAFSRDEIVVELMLYLPHAKPSPSAPIDIVVFDRATLTEKRRLPAEGGYAISLSANRAGLVVGVFQNGVELNQAPNTSWRHLVKGGEALFAVPSPSGRRVFFSSPTAGSMAVDVATASVVRGWRGATPAAAAWIGEDAVVTVGNDDGIRVLELGGQEVVSAHDTPLNAVAVAEDDRSLCAHSLQNGRLYCYFDR